MGVRFFYTCQSITLLSGMKKIIFVSHQYLKILSSIWLSVTSALINSLKNTIIKITKHF